MSTETATERKRKRIVEHIVGPFDNAYEAIRFGNTIESLVNETLNKKTKFRQSVGAKDTALAITKDYMGETMLKTVFLEIQENDAAQYICDQMKKTVNIHNEINRGRASVASELVRQKPLPQTIGG